jgi:hypothetical protein
MFNILLHQSAILGRNNNTTNLASPANSRYLEHLITLQISLINILKSKGPSKIPCVTIEEEGKAKENA